MNNKHDLKLTYLNTIKDDNALKIQKFETEKEVIMRL